MSLVPFVHLDTSFADASAGDRFPLSADDGHHLTRVLRLRSGSDLEVSDGSGGVAPARLHDGGVVLTAHPRFVVRPRPRLSVAQALPKARKFDDVVRQVCELGVDAVVPVLAQRCVARPDDQRADRLRERAEAVARAAGEQARRAWSTRITELTPTTGLPARAAGLGPLAPSPGPAGPRADSILLVAHVDAPALPRVLAGIDDAEHLCLAVGPEGGWSDAEVAQLVAEGALLVGLGPSVLRTEHAAAAGVAALAACTGRWG